MRRVLGLFFAIALALGLCGCSSDSSVSSASSDSPESSVSSDVSDYPYYDMERVAVENYAANYPRNIMDLEACPLIIRGTAQKSAESYPDTLETVVPVTVSKVFQDTISDVKKGDTIQVVEPYVVRGNGSGEELVASDGIMPSKVGGDYLYFLWEDRLTGESTADLPPTIPHYATSGPFCRFPWTDGRELSWEEIPDRVKGMTNRELYLRADVPLDEETMYRDLYALVIEAYMQSIPCTVIQID